MPAYPFAAKVRRNGCGGLANRRPIDYAQRMSRSPWCSCRPLLALAIIGGLCRPLPAAAADAVVGKAIAQRWCASCHLISGSRARDTAPPFAAIANSPDITSDRLAAFLTRPHGGMPDLALTEREIDDLDAYIRTLRQR